MKQTENFSENFSSINPVSVIHYLLVNARADSLVHTIFKDIGANKEVKFIMRTEKTPLTMQSSSNLFQDKYGVLQLAANATIASTPKPPKIMYYLRLKLIQWASSALTVIRQVLENNTITLSEFIWMESEPTDFIYELIWKKRMQKDENAS